VLYIGHELKSWRGFQKTSIYTHPRKGASTFQDFEATYWKAMKKTKNKFSCKKKKKGKKMVATLNYIL